MKNLRDPLWQGIGAIVALVALAVAIGAWLWPDIHSALFPPLTPTATPTLTSARPTPIAMRTLSAAPTATATAPPLPTKTPTLASTATKTPASTPTPTLGSGATRITEKDGMVMVYVPAGEFLMGSADSDSMAKDDEKPQHKVYLDAFWIDRAEVTNAQYNKCVQAGKCKASENANDTRYNGDNQPVVGVDWNDAKTYCEWAGGALPTEAQWEKAARGTDGRVYPWGNQAATCDYAVMYDGSKDEGCGTMRTWPVGSKPQGASPYGALDMAGNVWESVADWYDRKYYASSPAKNPTGPSSGSSRVLRGGSWGYFASDVRAADRFSYYPASRSIDIGFRCVGVGPGE